MLREPELEPWKRRLPGSGSGERVDGGQAIEVGHSLTPREIELLRLLATGMKIATAADELGLHYQTAKNHLTSIYDKLGATGMVDAFVKLGWLAP